jgi:hypothetical protein
MVTTPAVAERLGRVNQVGDDLQNTFLYENEGLKDSCDRNNPYISWKLTLPSEPYLYEIPACEMTTVPAPDQFFSIAKTNIIGALFRYKLPCVCVQLKNPFTCVHRCINDLALVAVVKIFLIVPQPCQN